jgi:hypothetical protein
MNTPVGLGFHIPYTSSIDFELGPHTKGLWECLDERGQLVSRTRFLDQLGNLRYVYPGAHHTRYEYMGLQWHLLNRLRSQDGGLVGLKARLHALDNFGSVTVEDAVQSYILLANVSHLPETLASERAVLHLLLTEPKVRSAFQDGLGDGRAPFVGLLQRRDPYNLHQLLLWFWLEREKAKTVAPSVQKVLEYATGVLEIFFDQETVTEQRTRMRAVFRAVRRLAYLALDSLFTPAPFTLQMSVVLQNIGRDFAAYVDGDAPFQHALDRLDRVMQELVYQSPDALLAMREVTRRRVAALRKVKKALESRDALADCFYPPNEAHPLYRVLHGPSFSLEDAASAPQVLFGTRIKVSANPQDWVAREEEWERAIGPTSRVGLDYDLDDETLGIAVGMTESGSPWPALTQVMLGLSGNEGFGAESQDPGLLRAVKWAVTLWLKPGHTPWLWDYQQHRVALPVFAGCTGPAVAEAVSSWLKQFRDVLSASTVAELELLERVAAATTGMQALLGYGGSTRIRDWTRKIVAEFDGLLHGIDKNHNPTLIIVEAKTGADPTEAKRQLMEHVPRVFHGEVCYRCEEGGAVAVITL